MRWMRNEPISNPSHADLKLSQVNDLLAIEIYVWAHPWFQPTHKKNSKQRTDTIMIILVHSVNSHVLNSASVYVSAYRVRKESNSYT